jgi:vancomycin resistance protein YoaR
VLIGAATMFAVIEAVGIARGAAGGLPARPAPEESVPVANGPTTAVPSDTATTAVPLPSETATVPVLDQAIVVNLVLRNGETVTSTITPSELAAIVGHVETQTVINTAALVHTVDPALFQVVKPAADARFRIVDDSVTIVPSRVGLQVTPESLATAVAAALVASGESRTVTLDPLPILPRFTTADAAGLGITELVSSYTQQFPAAAYRTINIGRAARYISGTVLLPGQVFSMNDTIKARTPENGYTAGWIIGPNGVFIMKQGGAVSTMTTAMYNAVWFSGMQFIEHRAHSIYISRYPAGREATVSWGDFDMKFKNNLQHAVFITTKLHRASVDVFIWGTREWSSIGTVFGAWTNKVAYSVIRSTEPACHPQDGMIGFHITTWRTFFRDGVEVKREPFHTSYRPSPQVICVKPTPSQSPATPTPTA